MTTFEEKLSELKKLCNLFQDNIKQYKSPTYDEANTRTDFIDKFFKLLEWDVNNAQGFSEEYKEVVREDKVVIEGKPKAPDYSFRIGGVRKFFVEAKKPSVNIKEEVEPAFQVRRYGYTAQVPLCILTDFEEFAIYDTRIKPHKEDDASVARIFYCTYLEYEKHFEFLYNTFSKNAILKGSFARYVEENKNKKGTSSVDKEILISIETWRESLAKNIALNNPNLDVSALNVSVQTILDRIIFLRIAEDRNMEKYGSLLEAAQKKEVFQNLEIIFNHAHKKYNSELFQNKTWISELRIEDKVLQNIIQNLYYPDSPYEFSILPIEILGNIYEQFLGKTLRLTSSHQAKLEEKEEVRKAGGVYYTPQYIVDYIIENTLGAIIKERELDLYTHPKLTLLDPACGSGSFLVRAYDYLLNAYLQTYTSKKYLNKALKNGLIYEIAKDTYKLSIPVKQQILLDHIYGVDVDPQAVEVTKLSLLLKLLENENAESAGTLFKYSDLKLLPDLSHNVKCGNSLISSDFYKEKDLSLFGTEEMRKINAFDWEKEFPKIWNSKDPERGFDVIVGNPPWVDIKGHPNVLVQYYFQKYTTTENRINLYAIFIERALQLLTSKGHLGFVIPNSILYQSSYTKLRKLILDKWSVNKIVRLPDKVFSNVKAESMILIINSNSKKTECIIYDREEKIHFISSKNAKEVNFINSARFLKNQFFIFDIFTDNKKQKLLTKIESNKIKLESLCEFSLGITPYDKHKGHTKKQIKNRVFHSSTKKDETFKPVLEGSDVTRYFVQWSGKEYISYGEWLGAPREKRFFTKPRILVRQIVSGKPLRIYAGYTNKELYNTQSIFNLILKENVSLDLKYILAILNSKLMNFYHQNKFLDLSKNLFQKILIQNCKKFPIPNLDLQNPKHKTVYEKLISLVSEIIEVKKKLHEVKLDSDKKFLEQKLELLDSQVDQLVYQVYELTEEEIQIIEEGF